MNYRSTTNLDAALDIAAEALKLIDHLITIIDPYTLRTYVDPSLIDPTVEKLDDLNKRFASISNEKFCLPSGEVTDAN